MPRYTKQDRIRFQKFLFDIGAATLAGHIWRYRAECGHGMNIASLSGSMEIPRETGRRAVNALIEAGKLVRREDGLDLADDIKEDFVEAMDTVVDCMIETSRSIEKPR